MVEYSQRIQATTQPSPARRIEDSRFVAAEHQRDRDTDTAHQTSRFNVEDKVDLQLEPEAIRQLQPNTHLKFVVNDDSNRVIVQIIQSDTNQVLREVPPKSLSDALASLNGSLGKQIR